ncbi:PSD1 and planctomycete cytochrome C domain-containing protein [Roseimaritima ulvae]|uniref:Planctomycete cytochrome C n=1 Tax=Roseimaritima ulvae TaxID=980254 RepID=A0A5B9QI28_9BACT|nr:PSD1 and planctomycete cytochrome C domain-containing protein [Roseimaritima ulvae]QEG38708.1 Planctomycete cytochrome C [Roseimaritima ulvae]
MTARPLTICCCALWATVFLVTLPTARAADKVSYSQQVRPILSDKCFFCHGPDPNTREADLRLDTEQGLYDDLGGYAAVVPGDIQQSEALRRILSDDPDLRMPPAAAHKELTEQEIEILTRWVEQGAEFEMHWAYRPLQRPPVPETRAASGQPARATQPIDAFIEAPWAARNIHPAPPAEPATLVRRLYLDLLGVPPTPAEVDEFVADPSEAAYQHLVAKLLNDPRYGERMAVYWLDLVRYADTVGYHADNAMEVSAYRDYVIEAFNRNMPFDQFTIEQLAGDLLPEASESQLVASGYNRLLQTTQEGGAQPKEYIAIYAADRVRNVSSVWMGSTLGCAQCHDHKYDPFSAKDFYSMAAFFADIKETAVGKQQPNLKLLSDQQRDDIAALDHKIADLQSAMQLDAESALAAQIAAGQVTWEQSLKDSSEAANGGWQTPEIEELTAGGGAILKLQPDGAILHTGATPAKTDFQISLRTSGTVHAIRLEALADESFPGPGRLSRGNGNFVLTGFEASVDGKPLPIAKAEADHQQPGFPVAAAIDDDAQSGWAVSGHAQKAERRVAVFTLKEPWKAEQGEGLLRITMRHQSPHTKHAVGRFRISLTDDPTAGLDGPLVVPESIRAIVAVPASERSAEQRERLAAFYRPLSPELQAAEAQLKTLREQRNKIQDSGRPMLITERLPKPRMTRILPRGNWLDETGEVVQPAVPEFMTGAETATEPRVLNRLDLANWLVEESNPLTARALVNRLWSLFYGRGLSRNLEDLGGQGQPPTHPELLDWLAVELQDSGWDIKYLVTLMVNAEAYRRSSVPTSELKAADATNQWFARQGRWRLDAEFVRDTALQLSGLLVDETIGGPSVKPYQPAGYWQHLNFPKRSWQADRDQGLYRRSLYTFWCRTFLHPSMLAFDAPSREECTAQRSRSNIPQQALVLLNDPIFVEASRGFAQRIVAQDGTPRDRIVWACQQAFTRPANDQEVELLLGLYEAQLQRYSDDPDAAKALLEVGQSAAAATVPTAELAAWTQVARAIINAYETISRY